MDEIISYKICAVKVRNAKLRNYLKALHRNPRATGSIPARGHIVAFFTTAPG
jgi:hypothetical protein